jgi:hypothetical protein
VNKKIVLVCDRLTAWVAASYSNLDSFEPEREWRLARPKQKSSTQNRSAVYSQE